MTEVLGAYGSALTHYLDPQFLLFLILGAITGLFVGIVPGIGPLTAIALFMPFVFFLGPWQSLPFIIACISTSNIGGTVTTYLMGIPGDTCNMPGLMDGFAMAKKGECARALGAAQMGSFLGSLYTVFFTLLMVPIVAMLVLTITSSEMVFLVLLGIAMIVTLSSGSMIKGVISGLGGLLASLIGYQLSTGVSRFTFDSDFLYDGLPLLPVMLGLFALTALVDMMGTGSSLANKAQPYEGWQGVKTGVKDVFHFWRINLLGSIIGYITGILPGVGSAIAGWISYGLAKTTSKHPELFGTGIVEGVIGPESANDAREAGCLLTLFALGIPSGGSHVLFLAAVIMLGLVPGPKMMTENLDIVGGMIMIKLASATFAVIVTLLLAPTLAKLAYVPGRYIVPIVLVFVYLGVFSQNTTFSDFFTLVLFGAIGIVMQKFGFSRPAFILGFILGDLFEKYVFISIMAWGPTFFLKPSNIVLIIIVIALLAYSPVLRVIRNKAMTKAGAHAGAHV